MMEKLLRLSYHSRSTQALKILFMRFFYIDFEYIGGSLFPSIAYLDYAIMLFLFLMSPIFLFMYFYI